MNKEVFEAIKTAINKNDQKEKEEKRIIYADTYEVYRKLLDDLLNVVKTGENYRSFTAAINIYRSHQNGIESGFAVVDKDSETWIDIEYLFQLFNNFSLGMDIITQSLEDFYDLEIQCGKAFCVSITKGELKIICENQKVLLEKAEHKKSMNEEQAESSEAFVQTRKEK